MKNLAEVTSRIKRRAAGATKPDEATARGKIVEFLWYLKNNGYSDATIRTYRKILSQLSELGADLLDPESVKEVIAKQHAWSENTKLHVTNAYNTFLEKFLNLRWKPPKYRKQEKIPYVPTEEEIDQLIAGSGKKLSAFLQLLKETGMRCGEAIRLKWTDVDFRTNVVRVEAEKGSRPRILPVSSRLIAMLENLPKTSLRIWPGTMNSMRFNLQVTRARLARKLDNPRLRRISFHSIRHWKGTVEYHKTKDVIHVQQLLGHKAIKSTMLYINIENAIYAHGKPEEFHVKVAHSLDEACKLLEVGFEYVTDMEGAKLFRKRK
jgi:integrase/recombinase XerD